MGGAVFVRTLQLQHDLPGAVELEPFVGDGRPGDIAAELLEFLALIGAPAHRRMEAKAVRVDTQLWGGRPGSARQALQAQYFFREYYIPDFTNWNSDDAAYKKEFDRLLRDLNPRKSTGA
jgi:hypothetical protein